MGSSSSSFTSSSPSFSSSSSSYSDEEFASYRRSPHIDHSVEAVERRALTLLGRIPLRSKDILKVNELLNRTTVSERSRLVARTTLLRTLLSLIAHFSKLKGGEEENGDASRRDSGIHDSSIVFRRKESLASAVSRKLEPRGIGYGVGSTKSKWDIERVMEERCQIERRLTALLLTVTTLFRAPKVPSVDCTSSDSSVSPHSSPPQLDQAIVEEMVGKSCLLGLLAHHLNNDSVFDVSMHIALYQALFELLAVMVGRQELLVYSMRQCGAMGRTLFAEQLPRFQLTLSAYPSTIQRHHSSADQNFTSFIEQVNVLAEKLREKLRLIDVQTDGDEEEEEVVGESIVETADNTSRNNEMKQAHLNLFYTELLESHQMRSHRLLNDAGRPIYGYTFKRELRSVDPHPESSSHRERTRRIAKELASMHNALPLNASNSIFVVMDETRYDMLKVLVSGPDDTPYQNGLFEFDVWFPQSYPNSPPKCAFLTTGSGAIRFNPNLYSDGKICLSILGTWEGRPEEKWNPLCSLLQVLISIQGLIFVRQPYFNEPGYERLQGTVKGDEHSSKYNLHIENATLIYAILRQFEDPPPYIRDVIKRHFWAKREAVIEQAERWLRSAAKDIQRRSNDPQASVDAESSIMEGALMGSCLYRREVRRLIEVFDRMTSPES